jgi:hypothetical protein
MAYTIRYVVISASMTLLAACSDQNPLFHLEPETTGSDATGQGMTTDEPPTSDTRTSETPTDGATDGASATSEATTDASSEASSSGPLSVGTTDDDTGSSGGADKCGDGMIEAPEECDEGTDNNDVGNCQPDCTFNECGDGFKGPNEACDLGLENNDQTECTYKCEPVVCGDGVVSGGEQCDQGQSNGLGTGMCGNDCSAMIATKKHIYRSKVLSVGDLDGIEGADQRCQEDWGMDYKAMLSDGDGRIASLTPYTGDGQVDWVLQEHVAYAGFNGFVFVTGKERLLGVIKGKPAPLLVAIGEGDAWTGLEETWLSSPDDCMNWAVMGAEAFGMSGDVSKTEAGEYLSGKGAKSCAQKGAIYCVQQ